MNNEQIKKYCKLDKDSEDLLEVAFKYYHLSARAYNRILKRDHIQEEPEVLENISYIKDQYRKLAEKYGIKIIDTTNKTYKELRKLVMED